jgi:hypothetical protein
MKDRLMNCLIVMAMVLLTLHCARKQAPSVDTAPASRYFKETKAICDRDSGKLWGVQLYGPVLLVDPQTRVVIANQADKEGVLVKKDDVFTGILPDKVNMANTATQWAGIKWTMLILPLPGDEHRRAGLLTHELWHRVQDDIGFPGSGAANSHLDSIEGRVWLQLEWRALAAALLSKDEEKEQAVKDALLFRACRRSLFPAAASEEREMEMHEGLAEYTGIRLCGSPDLKQFVVSNNLKEGSQKQTFVRSFAYASGPAYGLLLDETGEDWRKSLNKDDDLGALLQTKLNIKLPENIKEEAEVRAKSYDGQKLMADETARDDNHRKILAACRAKLVDGPVLTIPLRKMNMQFNPNTLLPLDQLGTVYPEIRIVDEWGILTVSKGALINANFTTISVTAPSSPGASPIEGDGWKLELNKGWKLTEGERKGDYTIK